MVEVGEVKLESDIVTLWTLLSKHVKYTDSAVAKVLLCNWERELKKFVRVMPHEYKQQAAEIHFPNGSKVILGNYKGERDLDRYMGQEYDLIYCMESNQLTFAKKKFIPMESAEFLKSMSGINLLSWPLSTHEMKSGAEAILGL
jgi:hypothetical protein